MNVLVTGASGFVGQAVCRALLGAGLTVTAAVRARSADGVDGCRTITVGDLDGMTRWGAALKGVDAIVHLAARTHADDDDDSPEAYRRVNVEATEALGRAAAQAGVSRFVYMSSIKVNGELSRPDSDGQVRALSGTDEPQPTTDYGCTKWEAEKALSRIADSSNMALVMLRPPLVYGPGQKANMLQLMHIIDRGVPLPFANLDNRRSLIYVGNLAAAVVCALEAPVRGCHTYTLADVDISTADLIRAIARSLGKHALLFSLPLRFIAFLARAAGRGAQFDKLTGSLVVERERIAAELGWSPPHSFEQALAETAEWYRVTEQGR